LIGRHVVADPAVCHGQPTFRGTRILVADVLEQISAGMAWESIVEEWRQQIPRDAIAEEHGALFGPHHGKSGVGMMASLHVQCAATNTGYLEHMYDPGFWNPEGFQAGFAEPWPVRKDGHVEAPEAPGLGILRDKKFFSRHKLQME
jgi:uncharacterized protein (DUF433 family)